MEQEREERGRVPAADQIRLRRLLRLPRGEVQPIRERVIELLNPAGVPVVHLNDRDLGIAFRILSPDNYHRLLDRGPLNNEVCFDATHGYYVVPEVEPL